MKKNCSKCKIEKDDADFAKNQSWCKACCREYYLNNKKEINEKQKNYYIKNKEKIKERNLKNKEEIKEIKKAYYSNNKKIIKENNAKYQENNKEKINMQRKKYCENNKEKNKNRAKKYREDNKGEIKKRRLKNKEKRNEAVKKRIKNDIKYKLHCLFSRKIRRSLKKNNASKKGKSCINFIDVVKLKVHLEAQFETWMTWDNHGIYNSETWDDNDQSTWTWQIDHIVPHSHFYYTSMDDEDFKKCWALENLRPYSAKQNVLDGNRR